MLQGPSAPLFLRLLLALLAALLAIAPAAAKPVFPDEALGGAWTPGAALAKPADPARMQAFGGRRLTQIARGTQGAWVRLDPPSDGWPTGPWRLVIEQPGMGSITLLQPGHPVQAGSLRRGGDALRAPNRLAFRVDRLQGTTPLWLYLAPSPWLASSMRFVLRSPAQWQRRSVESLAYNTAMLSALALSALMALWFALLLRERAYLSYAVFVTGYALLDAISSGYAFEVLRLGWIDADPTRIARLAGSIAGMASILFTIRFAELYRLVPRSRVPLRIVVGLFATIAVLCMAPLAPLRTLGAEAQNPVVVAAGAILLSVLVLAWRRGGRYAGFVLLGWAPLVVLTVCESLQGIGHLLGWAHLQTLQPAAALFEALVLIAGLADRTLAARNDHREALRMAEIDPLTGTLNRGALLARLREMMQPGAHAAVSVLFIDLDHFKRLNDEAGHQAGDAALQALVRTLTLELRGADLLGRYGGEEFMVLLPGQGLSQALAVAERLLGTVRRRRLSVRPDLPPMTVSIGAAEAHPGESIAHLLERADQAMYTAKRNGRDQVCSATSLPLPA